ncbi:hypothetical protein AAHE18_03G112900 [Arachis hypogaea]
MILQSHAKLPTPTATVDDLAQCHHLVLPATTTTIFTAVSQRTGSSPPLSSFIYKIATTFSHAKPKRWHRNATVEHGDTNFCRRSLSISNKECRKEIMNSWFCGERL